MNAAPSTSALPQEGHFNMLFAAAQDAGFMDPAVHRCDHVGFGLVVGPDGKKLKTRAGETIRCAAPGRMVTAGTHLEILMETLNKSLKSMKLGQKKN